MPITTEQVENLLYCYKEIYGLIQNLNLGLQQNDNDSLICSMIIGNKTPTGMPLPNTGNITDSTGQTASAYRDKIDSEKAINKYELDFYQSLVDRLDAGIDALNARHQFIIEKKYYDNRTMVDIGRALGVTRRLCIIEKKRALQKLIRMLIITQPEYKRFEKFFKDSMEENRNRSFERGKRI